MFVPSSLSSDDRAADASSHRDPQGPDPRDRGALRGGRTFGTSFPPGMESTSQAARQHLLGSSSPLHLQK